MSRFKGYAKKGSGFDSLATQNFMGGISYSPNPLTTLRIIAASSIFGEPSYYRTNDADPEDKDSVVSLFERHTDEALSYDFKGTLSLAVRLRNEFNMRLNPAVIMVRAALHKDRATFNKDNGDFFSKCLSEIFVRPDDVSSQFEYYMFRNGDKKGIPTILKKNWSKFLSSLSAYSVSKYKKTANIIDMTRISHAHSDVLTELLRTGNVRLDESEKTWENLRSDGKTWGEILDTIYIPHMALLRNLRNIFSEDSGVDSSKLVSVLETLENGVANGRQFPFRYYSAWAALKNADEFGTEKSIRKAGSVYDSLQKCIDVSMANFPVLKGRVACLSDNSGSAWGAFTSEYGSTVIAEIANLSSVMTAYNASDDGDVFVFGDDLKKFSVSKRDGVLSQVNEINKYGKNKIGKSTEHGIWMFFDQAMKNREHYDHIFIYSDMQAGHGGLYGKGSSYYKKYCVKSSDSYIDVMKMADDYRNKVNPKVNFYSTQVAGYDNSVLPENMYRSAILSGWTGKEVLYAKEMSDIWDLTDTSRNSSKEQQG